MKDGKMATKKPRKKKAPVENQNPLPPQQVATPVLDSAKPSSMLPHALYNEIQKLKERIDALEAKLKDNH